MSALAGISFPSAANFTFRKEIGHGGMGIVYLAEKQSEGVRDYVVLKTIRTMRDRQIEMLKHEANVAATLRHENIVRTFGMEAIPFDRLPDAFRNQIGSFDPEESTEGSDAEEFMTCVRMGLTHAVEESMEETLTIPNGVTADKRLYLIVMEYVEGWDLRKIHRQHIKAGVLLPIILNAFIISRVCRALEYAHQFIVHRDLSPENILLNNQGVTKLMDFGLAVAADEKTYGLAGKIQYMAPEQVLGGNVDNRSDIFALGLVAYHLLTGVSLFVPPKGLDFMAQADHYGQLIDEPIPPPHEVCRDIPEAYSRIIMKMLAIRPGDRYQKIDEAGSEIEKEYIYAEGFGPTNNSLAAYRNIFESDFKNLMGQDLQHLSFMTPGGRTDDLQRRIRKDLYTEKGRALLKARRS